MKKITTIIMIALLVSAMAAGISYSANGVKLTTAQFVDIIVRVMGLEIPEEVRELPPNEHFEALANILATKGIGVFINTTPDDTITNEELVEVLYIMVGGKDAGLDNSEKLNYLVDNGYVPSLDLNADATVDDVTRIFENPALTGPIAEAYREPAGEPRTGSGADFNVPGATRDNPASQT
jgi:hypothetical protein